MPTALHRLPVEHMTRQATQRSDGRHFDYYSFATARPRPATAAIEPEPIQTAPDRVRELRWHPLLETWNLVAGDRHLRPTMPEGCPFCPGGAEELESFAVAAFDNRFPALVADPGPQQSAAFPAARRPARGAAEVIVYSPVHEGRFATLSPDAVLRLVQVWADRERLAFGDPEVEFVFPFENRGEDAGNTLSHPHGQLFAFPFLPPRVQDKLDAARSFRERHHDCLMCCSICRFRGSRSHNISRLTPILCHASCPATNRRDLSRKPIVIGSSCAIGSDCWINVRSLTPS